MASKNISFDQITSSIRKPGKYIEFNTKPSVRTLPQGRQKLLIIAQRTSSGTVAELVPTDIFADVEAAEYFGYGSQAHLMAKSAIDANPYVALTVCALDDAVAGTPAVGTITIDNTASSSGALTIWVANQKVVVAVTKDDTANAIATAVASAITAKTSLPVTASAANAVVTVTAKNDGTVGNGIGLDYEVTNSAVSVTIVAMASGATDPDISEALAVVYPEQYDVIASFASDQTSLTAVRTHLDNVSGPMEQRPGIAVYGYTGVLADATTLAGNINSGRILCAYVRGSRSLTIEIAAAMASVIAFEEDPARPLNTLALNGIHAPAISSQLSRTEQESLLYNGVTPFEVGPGEKVQVVRAVSTYTQDANGIDDVSLLDITTIRTLDYVRKACRERIALRFPREKLSSKTPAKVKSELLDVLFKLEDLEIVEEVDANKDALVVERDLQDVNRLDAKIPTDVVNGLHVFAGRIDLLL